MKYDEYLGKAFDEKSGELSTSEMTKQVESEKKTINMLLIGASGVGKSTLINAVFGYDVAKAGVGKPVTQHLEKHHVRKKGLILWDTKGIEAADYESTKKDLSNELEKATKNAVDNNNSNEMPDVAWLCIKEDSKRVEDREIYLVKLVYGEYKIRVVVIFTNTQHEAGDEFVQQAKNIFLKKACDRAINDRYVRVNSLDYSIQGHKIKKSGLDDLLEITYNALPEASENKKQALMKAQKVDAAKKLDAMVNSSEKIVHIAAAAAGTAGACPIPGSDAPIIAAIQSKMIYSINSEFELNSTESHTTSVVMGILGLTALAQVGKAVVSNTLKFIPGVGTLIGGAISAATAATLTEAVGHAYIKVLEHYYDAEQKTVMLPKEAGVMMDMFKTFFKN